MKYLWSGAKNITALLVLLSFIPASLAAPATPWPDVFFPVKSVPHTPNTAQPDGNYEKFRLAPPIIGHLRSHKTDYWVFENGIIRHEGLISSHARVPAGVQSFGLFGKVLWVQDTNGTLWLMGQHRLTSRQVIYPKTMRSDPPSIAAIIQQSQGIEILTRDGHLLGVQADPVGWKAGVNKEISLPLGRSTMASDAISLPNDDILILAGSALIWLGTIGEHRGTFTLESATENHGGRLLPDPLNTDIVHAIFADSAYQIDVTSTRLTAVSALPEGTRIEYLVEASSALYALADSGVYVHRQHAPMDQGRDILDTDHFEYLSGPIGTLHDTIPFPRSAIPGHTSTLLATSSGLYDATPIGITRLTDRPAHALARSSLSPRRIAIGEADRIKLAKYDDRSWVLVEALDQPSFTETPSALGEGPDGELWTLGTARSLGHVSMEQWVAAKPDAHTGSRPEANAVSDRPSNKEANCDPLKHMRMAQSNLVAVGPHLHYFSPGAAPGLSDALTGFTCNDFQLIQAAPLSEGGFVVLGAHKPDDAGDWLIEMHGPVWSAEHLTHLRSLNTGLDDISALSTSGEDIWVASGHKIFRFSGALSEIEKK